MGSLAGSLPQQHPSHMNPGASYGMHDPSAMRGGYSGQHSQQYMMGRGGPGSGAPGSTQQQYAAPHYASLPHQMPLMSRQGMQQPPQSQYPAFDPYGYGMNPQHMQSMDPRMGPMSPYSAVPQLSPDPAQYARRASEPAPIPSFPRGPPRKPKQSGHALWVGNLPPNATVTDLKDHFSRDATNDIESLFLISKSNCAFVNYRTEAACIAAMGRFHDSRFGGVRLVCRLRRGSSASSASTTPTLDLPGPSSAAGGSTISNSPILEDISSPTIVDGSAEEAENRVQADASPQPTERGERVPERFFIVKSLTVQDLEASVQNGTWATQSHNEKTLNEAFESADNVYLIFSANKSGEYFGYARMASLISGEPVNLSSSTTQSEGPSTTGTPQSIPTPATATAPKGRIIDDSARGTIFWEADRSDNEEEETPARAEVEKGNQNWGRQFSIEWVSTARLPFYRTRGLRNPWK